ncbi:MAG: hypothetical protein IKI69_06075 [Oscillospiraceae bacterium]|nr:hypothetical protein [Oscillospiraceae bacterium]
MKKAKILVSLILALALVFSVSASAFAKTPPSNVVNKFKKFDETAWGAYGAYVCIAQRFLARYDATTSKFINRSGGVDGIFGDGTYYATVAFQTKVFSDGHEWDGIVGPKTWAKIGSRMDFKDRSEEGLIWDFSYKGDHIFVIISGNVYVSDKYGNTHSKAINNF